MYGYPKLHALEQVPARRCAYLTPMAATRSAHPRSISKSTDPPNHTIRGRHTATSIAFKGILITNFARGLYPPRSSRRDSRFSYPLRRAEVGLFPQQPSPSFTARDDTHRRHFLLYPGTSISSGPGRSTARYSISCHRHHNPSLRPGLNPCCTRHKPPVLFLKPSRVNPYDRQRLLTVLCRLVKWGSEYRPYTPTYA